MLLVHRVNSIPWLESKGHHDVGGLEIAVISAHARASVDLSCVAMGDSVDQCLNRANSV